MQTPPGKGGVASGLATGNEDGKDVPNPRSRLS